MDREHLLISLEERHAVNILAGKKRVELRRRAMHVNEGDLVWFYVKKPIGAIIGYAVVDSCTISTPSSAWKQFGRVSGLLKPEFLSYFDGTTSAFVLQLASPNTLKRPVLLDALRAALPKFHPPQFYCRLPKDSALRNLLMRRSTQC